MCEYVHWLKRFVIQAKRKDTAEEWTEWTNVDEYDEALIHAQRAREAGYLARIIDTGELNENEDQA